MLPDLEPALLNSAITLTFGPYQDTLNTGWENSAFYGTSEDFALLDSTFRFYAIEGATYDIFSTSYFDPFNLTLYDQNGAVIATDESEGDPGSTYGTDYISDYQATYTGYHYVGASWDQGSTAGNMFVSLAVYEDLDTIGLSPGVSRVGTAGSDYLPGAGGSDSLFGVAGNDFLEGRGGDDELNGGSGTDTAIYSGDQASYSLTLSPVSTWLEDRRPGGDGTDTLREVELLDFGANLFGRPFDLTDFGGSARLSPEDFRDFIELYIAYFDRAPDAVGLNFWATAVADGTTLEEMAALFIDQTEYRATYPDGTSDLSFVNSVYNNVLGRTPDQAGINFWAGVLSRGEVSRDQFILEVLRGAKSALKPEEGQAFVNQQLADRAYLEDKVDIGAYFAVHKGMSNTVNADFALSVYDGSQDSLEDAIAVIDSMYADALDPQSGEFLMQVIGVLDNPYVS